MIRSLFNQANSSKSESEQTPELSRRRFLRAGLGACAALALPMAASTAHAAIRRPFEKKLSFLNLHTGERTQAVFWANGRYIPEGMRAINYVLRDHRTGDRRSIDPDLFDLLYLLQHRLGTRQEFHVISAYRSPATNAKLAEQSGGVAKNSMHTHGKAIDIRLPGRKLSDIRSAAMSLQAGGVGYYPSSNFIHLDTGNFRYW
ncbi:MAG: DUF882 domain-containing protein [Nitrosomonas sp.]|jgi:uncharacterized protein YcbK (DUF882 family)|uniref:Murein endopeptidase K n=1 Tax=Nitrosomonas oligotropha TaxID=42354 RepID=A0A2T5I1A3_9PROT|nr:DUF882 domain-containing protein [Nitrosomonas oligotropha]MBK7492750.1 DUF882 domain-containing protein [Nitrosomonas sp.]MBP9100632.1 DUF882 domain-containing protein [Nitrosomonas sp.]PTQ77604.1 uncharacterized protein YcbK (DUF882 family) [Nitrosomonas oligotropha]